MTEAVPAPMTLSGGGCAPELAWPNVDVWLPVPGGPLGFCEHAHSIASRTTRTMLENARICSALFFTTFTKGFTLAGTDGTFLMVTQLPL